MGVYLHLALMLCSAASIQGNTCLSRECISLSSQIASWINQTADPCENFYEYACGNFGHMTMHDPQKAFLAGNQISSYLFESTTSLLEGRVNRRLFEILVRQGIAKDSNPHVRDLYRMTSSLFSSCVQWMRISDMGAPFANYREASAAFFKGAFYRLKKNFSFLINTAEQESKGLAERTFSALISTGADGVFKVKLPKSFAETAFLNDQKLAGLVRAVISVTITDYPVKGARIEQVVDFLARIGVSSGFQLADANAIFALDLESLYIALVDKSWVCDCPVSVRKTKLTLAELNQLSKCVSPDDSFSWTFFFETLLNSRLDPEAEVVVLNPRAVVNFANYFKRKIKLSSRKVFLQTSPVRFLVLDWLLGFSSFLPGNYQQSLRESRVKKFYLTLQTSSPIKACLDLTSKYLQPLVSRMYHRVYLSSKAFAMASDLIYLITNASIHRLQKQDWITGESKESMIRKLRSLKYFMGFEELSDSQLIGFYATSLTEFRSLDMTRLPFKNFGQLLTLSLKAYSRKNFDLLSGATSVSVFVSCHPMTVNAFNYFKNNKVVFPMAVLAPPFFHETFPHYANLAGLGSIIAHEIGHAFDIEGHEYDYLGRKSRVWDAETHKNFLRLSDCVKNRFASLYGSSEANADKIANQTLSEDISDLMSTGTTFQALQQSFADNAATVTLPNLSELDLTPRQIFFILSAQRFCDNAGPELRKAIHQVSDHSQDLVRVNGMVMSSDDFGSVFQCKTNDATNPAERCNLW